MGIPVGPEFKGVPRDPIAGRRGSHCRDYGQGQSPLPPLTRVSVCVTRAVDPNWKFLKSGSSLIILMKKVNIYQILLLS